MSYVEQDKQGLDDIVFKEVDRLTNDVYPGMPDYQQKSVWTQSRDFRISGYPSAEVQRSLIRLVKADRIVLDVFHPSYGGRRTKQYATKAKFNALQAERALSPDQRTERFMARFRESYLANQRSRGDQVSLWPIDLYIGDMGGDVGHAIDAGMVKVIKGGWGTRYVPTEFWDEYEDDMALQSEREVRAQAHHDSVKARLLAFAGKSERRGRHTVELNTEQIERLLKHLEVEQSC